MNLAITPPDMTISHKVMARKPGTPGTGTGNHSFGWQSGAALVLSPLKMTSAQGQRGT